MAPATTAAIVSTLADLLQELNLIRSIRDDVVVLCDLKAFLGVYERLHALSLLTASATLRGHLRRDRGHVWLREELAGYVAQRLTQ